ncbi:MAG: hypothetical protein ACRYFU_00905 [Janthinobacterium lividum]
MSEQLLQPQRFHDESHTLELPAPTIWPMVLALGFALMGTAMVTNISLGILGLLLTCAGAVGWFRQVLPHEVHEPVPVHTEEIVVTSTRTMSARLPQGETHRKILPVETFRVTTGLKGGLAGGAAMTIPAALYGLLKYHSIWYAANLLAAGGFVSWGGASSAFLSQFHLQGFVAALIIHGIVSLLIGLLYGAVLPIFPRVPILTAGILVPLFFTAITYSALGVVSPILNQRIDWFWFVASQIVFGLVCGYVVNLQEKVRTPQFRKLPFGVRAGLHGDHTRLSGTGSDNSQEDESK